MFIHKWTDNIFICSFHRLLMRTVNGQPYYDSVLIGYGLTQCLVRVTTHCMRTPHLSTSECSGWQPRSSFTDSLMLLANRAWGTSSSQQASAGRDQNATVSCAKLREPWRMERSLLVASSAPTGWKKILGISAEKAVYDGVIGSRSSHQSVSLEQTDEHEHAWSDP